MPGDPDFRASSRLASFRHALSGLRALFAGEPNARLQLLAAALAVTAGLFLGLSRGEWLAVVLAIALVTTAEALNTAFEALCDVASPKWHPQVKRAKDVAAGGVLWSATGAAVIGALVFGPRLLALFD